MLTQNSKCDNSLESGGTKHQYKLSSLTCISLKVVSGNKSFKSFEKTISHELNGLIQEVFMFLHVYCDHSTVKIFIFESF